MLGDGRQAALADALADVADRGIQAGLLENVDGLDDVVVADTGAWHGALLGRKIDELKVYCIVT